MSKLLSDHKLQDKCVSIQILTRLDDQKWKEKFGNDGGLYGFIKSQKIAHADMCIGKDHSKKTYDDMADSTANMETSDIIEASMEIAAMAREDLLRHQQRQRNK